jgi:bacillithiol biosynthesis cysteine-adding enzyme BshC
MKKHCVELDQTGQFSPFFLDYITGKEQLKPFYAHAPSIESFKNAIQQKNFSSDQRAILLEALRKQYQGIELSEVSKTALESISDPKTFTVTTGHQLNLFTGPLYFIFKIVSTINLARKLKAAYPEFQFLPVYWMASEDHDFEEINYFKLDGQKYQWNSSQTGAVGDFELDASFKAFLKTTPFAPDFFKEAYTSSQTLAEAVRKYVHALFGEEGLLIVDGNDAALKKSFSKVMLEDLIHHIPFQKASEKTDQLASLGYKSQIFPREINLFYLVKGIRERIEKTTQGFSVLNTDLNFSESEIRVLVEQNPERFSPNVVLRPLYQEMILPNLAYLGGPAEVIYWLQLKGVFDHFQVSFPVLLPRNFGLILDQPIQAKIHKMGWSHEDLFQDFESWKRAFVMRESTLDIKLEHQKETIDKLFEATGAEAALLDASLLRSFEAGKVRSLKILDQMSVKLRKAEERRLKTQLDRGKVIHEFTKPGGSPQERVVNMMQFYLNHPDLIQDLLDCFDPLDFRMMVLSL